MFFFQAEDGIRDDLVTGVQTCALPILIAKKLGDLWVDRVRHIAEARAFAGSGDRRQISFGSVSGPIDAMTTCPATTLVGFHERAAHDLLDWRQRLHELASASA